jgi:hypothetical protein
MKKLIVSALCATMALSLSITAFAASPMVIAPAPENDPRPGYTLQIDGKDTGVRACIMVPLRATAEKLGFTVTWKGDGTILLDDGTMNSTVAIGRDLYQVTTIVEGMVGMSAPFSLGIPPFVTGGTTYVPLGLFDALLGSQQGAVTMEDGVICLDTDPLSKDNNAQIANPFVDCDTLNEAIKITGFDLTVPSTINKATDRLYRVMTLDDKMLEVIYQSGEDEAARIRKAPGAEDISGDNNEYAQANTVSVDGAEVTMRGNNGMVYLAIWNTGGYTYSVNVTNGISSNGMMALVSEIH